MRVAALLIAFAGLASAFTTPAPLKAVTARGMGYVPDGLNPAQYEALKKKEAAAKAASKKKAMKGSVETLTDFNFRQEKKFPNQPGAGHIFVKLKGKALEPKLKPRAGL